MIRFASLGSGSRGNALVVESGKTRLLLDCGFSTRETRLRLERLSVEPETLDGILVTHEHLDHARGVFPLARRYNLPVWLTHGTLAALDGSADPALCHLIDNHVTFTIGDLTIQPFPVPHDARQPVQFIFSDGQARLAVLTDCGNITPHIIAEIGCCDALVLEFNHDPPLLAESNYPLSLQRRILGAYGHLSNRQAIELLSQLDLSRLQHLVAAHLSEQNNRPEQVRRCIESIWAGANEALEIANQAQGFSWRSI